MSQRGKSKRRFSCLGCFLLILFVMIISCAGSEALVYFFGAPQMHTALTKINPAPGQLLEIDHARMHIYCEGQGPKTVVISGKNGELSLIWRDVQSKMAAKARVCIYDRLGYGWSDAAGRERSVDNIVEEMDGLINAAGIEPGFILVGEGGGAVYSNLYAWTHPEKVSGLLVVDDLRDIPPAVFDKTVAPLTFINIFTSSLSTSMWYLTGDKWIDQQKKYCLPWMDDDLCTQYAIFYGDGNKGLTDFHEEQLLSKGMYRLADQQVNYGSLPIVIVKHVAISETCEQTEYGRSSNCQFIIVPENNAQPLVEKKPQAILDAFDLLLTMVH